MKACGHVATDPGQDFGYFLTSMSSQHVTERADESRSKHLISPGEVAYEREDTLSSEGNEILHSFLLQTGC